MKNLLLLLGEDLGRAVGLDLIECLAASCARSHIQSFYE
jgi:hypothetical protein